MKLLQELNSAVNTLQTDLRNAGDTDAGASDVTDKANAQNDVHFKSMRNSINNENEVDGKDITDYISRAEDLNDEVDTIAFGIETDDGNVIKVYVNVEQAEGFEEALSNLLGLEEDLEDALNRLAGDYDIVDIVWPTVDGGEESQVEKDLEASGEDDEQIAAALDTNVEDDTDNADDNDDFEVVAALPAEGEPTAPGTAAPEDDTLNATDLPDMPAEDNAEEEATTYQLVNDAILAKYPEDDVTGISDLSIEQLGEVIDLEKADEIASSQYDAADFIGLAPDEQEDIINANPDIVLIDLEKKEDEPETDKEPTEPETEGPEEKEPKGDKGDKEPKADDSKVKGDKDDTEPKKDGAIPESKSFGFLRTL